MRGLLADVNVQGHMPYLRRLLDGLDLWTVLAELHIEIATFPQFQLDPQINDRLLWHYCQKQGWVLITDNRNDDGPDSLEATLSDSWQMGLLPILTLGNKNRFGHSRAYAENVAADIADLLFGIKHGEFRDQPRIYLPRAVSTGLVT